MTFQTSMSPVGPCPRLESPAGMVILHNSLSLLGDSQLYSQYALGVRPTFTGALSSYSSDVHTSNGWLISHGVFSILCSFFTFFHTFLFSKKNQMLCISYSSLLHCAVSVFTSVHIIRSHKLSVQSLFNQLTSSINYSVLIYSLIKSLNLIRSHLSH